MHYTSVKITILVACFSHNIYHQYLFHNHDVVIIVMLNINLLSYRMYIVKLSKMHISQFSNYYHKDDYVYF